MQTYTERITQIITAGASTRAKIGLDTNCVQYYLGNPPVQPWADCLDPVIRAGLAGDIDLYISSVVAAEILSHAHYSSRRSSGYDPELSVMALLQRNFQILDVTKDISRAAGRLRGVYWADNNSKLGTADALIGATSLSENHDLIITNDEKLSRALPPNNCVYLKELALEWLSQNFPTPCFASIPPVTLRDRGIGLPGTLPTASSAIGSLVASPTSEWTHILTDAFSVASGLNEPCLFFVLAAIDGAAEESREIIFWHEGIDPARPSNKIIEHMQRHLGYSNRTNIANHPNSRIYAFYFASHSRERARMAQPHFASKPAYDREAEAWNGYLKPLWIFRKVFGLPQSTFLLCENGTARYLELATTISLLERARNVLGWKDV